MLATLRFAGRVVFFVLVAIVISIALSTTGALEIRETYASVSDFHLADP